jgi:hypothetical protein
VGRAESRPLFVSLALPHANRCDQPRKQSVFRSRHPENGEDDDDEEDWEITLNRYGVFNSLTSRHSGHTLPARLTPNAQLIPSSEFFFRKSDSFSFFAVILQRGI